MAITLDQFMLALSGQESGGNPTEQNARTGAYGVFQIMPSNWPAWSRESGLPAGAPQDEANQWKVARFKLQQYYDRFGNWEDVASAWYSGQPRSSFTPEQLNRPQGDGSEPSIASYIRSVISRAGGSTSSGGGAMPDTQTYEADPAQIADLRKRWGDADAYFKKVRDAYLADPIRGDIDAVKLALAERDSLQEEIDNIEEQAYSRGRDAFSDSIALGDYQQGQADKAWAKYLDKRGLATDAAKAEIATISGHNEAQGRIAKAQFENFGQGPTPSDITYLPPDYEKTLDRYNTKFGVGEAPSRDPSTYGGPQTPGAAAAAARARTAADLRERGVAAQNFGSDLDNFPGSYNPLPPEPPYTGPSAGLPAGRVGSRAEEEIAGLDSTKIDRTRPKPRNGMELLQQAHRNRTAKKEAFWRRLRGGGGVQSYAGGTLSAQGGMARVGEKGPETMIDPQTGEPMMIGEMGPEMRDVPEGAEIYPADVPPDQAFAFSQMRRAVGSAPSRGQGFAEADARAADPDLQLKVLEALRNGIVANMVANPSATPQLVGQWSKPDPWQDARALNGEQPQMMPMAAAGGV